MCTSEELADLMPDYYNGRRPRPATTVRRLRPCLELVERGPNGSLTRGARYRIIGSVLPDVPDVEPIDGFDGSWLLDAIRNSPRKKKKS